MIGDINTYDDELLPTRWWRFAQWGTRGQTKSGPCGLTDCNHKTHTAYRYFFLKLPIFWYRQDPYSGEGTVHDDGRITYTRRLEFLSLLWTPWPGLRFHWERPELRF